MQKSKYFIVSVLILGAYLLSACSGVSAPVPSVVDDSQNGQLQEIVFTGAVESMGDGQWTISGQQVSVGASAFADMNIKVGDIVRVEARVSSDGSVAAVKIESSGADNVNANSNSNDANANDANANTNDNTNTGNDNSNGNSNANSNDAPAGPGQEILGVVEAITTDSITINGVVYKLANFTEFKGVVAVGSQVKIHVIVNADGTFTIREIEQTAGAGIGGDNGNSNGNSNDDNGNDTNVNDDNGNSNGNSNDDNGNDSNSNDDNGNDSNSNDDNGNDSDSNSNNND